MSIVIPFGKYKGSELEEVRELDPQYLDWLISQPDLSINYPAIAAAITNQGHNTQSPRHNLIQAQFLDNQICQNLCARLGIWGCSYTDEKHWVCACTSVRHGNTRYCGTCVGEVKTVEKRRSCPVETHRSFEDIFDVRLTAVNYGDRGAIVGIECKPEIGDDYPVVLRQVRQQMRTFYARNSRKEYGRNLPYYGPLLHMAVVYERLKSNLVSNADIVTIFGESQVHLIGLEEIGGVVAPLTLEKVQAQTLDFDEAP